MTQSTTNKRLNFDCSATERLKRIVGYWMGLMVYKTGMYTCKSIGEKTLEFVSDPYLSCSFQYGIKSVSRGKGKTI